MFVYIYYQFESSNRKVFTTFLLIQHTVDDIQSNTFIKNTGKENLKKSIS